jgi:hypothetical protein
MATFRVEAQITSDELLKAVEQLSPAELERFVAQVITLRAQQKAPHLPKAESELLLKINQGLPDGLSERYTELKAKRQAETLTPKERQELVKLTARVEKIQAQRAEHLAKLARLRKTTLTALMQSLGLQASVLSY